MSCDERNVIRGSGNLNVAILQSKGHRRRRTKTTPLWLAHARRILNSYDNNPSSPFPSPYYHIAEWMTSVIADDPVATDAGACISNTTAGGERVRTMERPSYVARQDSVLRFRIGRLIIRSRFNYDRRCLYTWRRGIRANNRAKLLVGLIRTVPRQTRIVCAFYIDNPAWNSPHSS